MKCEFEQVKWITNNYQKKYRKEVVYVDKQIEILGRDLIRQFKIRSPEGIFQKKVWGPYTWYRFF